MSYSSRLTSKSQVTIPKDVRVALGVGPGARVHFEIGDDGRVMLGAELSTDERERRKAEFIRRIGEARTRFKEEDTMPGAGMDGLAYQQWIRGPGPEV